MAEGSLKPPTHDFCTAAVAFIAWMKCQTFLSLMRIKTYPSSHLVLKLLLKTWMKKKKLTNEKYLDFATTFVFFALTHGLRKHSFLYNNLYMRRAKTNYLWDIIYAKLRLMLIVHTYLDQQINTHTLTHYRRSWMISTNKSTANDITLHCET